MNTEVKISKTLNSAKKFTKFKAIFKKMFRQHKM